MTHFPDVKLRERVKKMNLSVAGYCSKCDAFYSDQLTQCPACKKLDGSDKSSGLVTPSRKLDGSCPKCGGICLEFKDSFSRLFYGVRNKHSVTVDVECLRCESKVRESYCLVKSEVIEE